MTATQHRFSTKRTTCPKCGSSRGFAPVVGDPNQGFCHSCQTPMFGSTTQRQNAPTPRPRNERPQQRAPEILYDGSDNLSRFLIGLWQGGEPMRMHLQQWGVGSTPDGTTVFAHGNTTNKIMRYDGNGKRDKNASPSWHPVGEGVPLFGCQWLRDGATFVEFRGWTRHTYTKDTPVFILESEKSATLASFVFPSFVWLAAGGVSGVTVSKAATLRGRRVGVLFDADEAGSNGASKAADVLSKAGASARVLNLRDVIADAPDGMDIGDAVISQLQKPLVYDEEFERSAIQWCELWN